MNIRLSTWLESRCIAGSSWNRRRWFLAHAVSRGSQIGSRPATPVCDDEVAVAVAHWQFAARFDITRWAVSFATTSV